MDGGEEDILGVHLVEPGLVGELGDRCPGGREREMGSGCGQFLPFRCLKRSDSSEGRRSGERKGTVVDIDVNDGDLEGTRVNGVASGRRSGRGSSGRC
jgi:hypothetical protein